MTPAGAGPAGGVDEARSGAPEPEARVMLVCSAGGHLAQLLALQEWWSGHERMWVTFDKTDALSALKGERVAWAYHPTTRSLKNLARNSVVAWRTMRDFRPSVVISTGAAVAVPFFVLAKLFGVRTVYLEVYDRIDMPTLTGRLCSPLSDLVLLQWAEQKKSYPSGVVVGPVL